MKHTNNLLKSFVHAYNGIACASRERNVRFHFVATAGVLAVSYILRLNTIEWALILSAIVLVLITEFINTCIEMICDLINSEYSISIKQIKDIAAASVVLSALYASSISLLIIYPKLILYI